jgi:phosphoglycolate phosphatase
VPDAAPHRQLVLFDLDGTLIDSEPGIMESIHHAFTAIGAAVPPYDVLRTWIGPPFYQSFPTALDHDADRVEAAIGKYREHYEAGAWQRHAIYPGIDAAIAALDAAGCALAVVTTKIFRQARRIVDHLPFGAAFARVYGAELKTSHSAKAQMIAQAMADFGIAPERTAMIGDRHFDIDGARANGVHAIGVGWGFGSIEELRTAGADAIVHAPIDLIELLLPAPRVA